MTVNSVVIGWLLLPAIAAFGAALIPKLGRTLLWVVPLLSLGSLHVWLLRCARPHTHSKLLQAVLQRLEVVILFA